MKNRCGLIKNMHDMQIQDEYTYDFQDLFIIFCLNIINTLENFHANNIYGHTSSIVNGRNYIF